MKNFYRIAVLFTVLIFLFQEVTSQSIKYENNWGKQGFSLNEESKSDVIVNFSLTSLTLENYLQDGQETKIINVPGIFLPNNEGAPNLPGTGKYVAIPQGAEVKVNIIGVRTETISNIDILPSPRIPLDTEQGPTIFEKDMEIYSKDQFYPREAVVVSGKTSIRGLDVVMLGITPFQYNPITKELIIYKDIELEIEFIGGNGHFGEDRLRSRWWDPILSDAVLNSNSLPKIEYNKVAGKNPKSLDYEYLIISPNSATFLSWADSIKLFRNQQGIKTGVVTTTEIGGNTVSAIETYVNNAYNTWTVPPSAVLLLGDYGTNTTSTVTSQWYTHPAGYPDFVSDNRFADVTGNDLPDIAFARITANDASQLEVMITKFLDYERNPPSDANYYDHPITALGWQTERWFQICSEAVGGYFKNELGKNPVRINAVYDGNPSSDPWSTATNTSTVTNYFGPSGLGYIPATPSELGGWTGGTATDVVNAINSGSFLLQHRDHGSYTGWGEPAFQSTSINSLTNVNNKLPYIFSINCQTGAFHRSTECFTEKFHRHTYGGQNSGALGVLAATEVSYSFVNDTYLWGVMDNLFPGFMPAESTTFPVNYVMPAFGNAAGKHFLYQSSWPYNTSNKQITYRLFHHHGGAFLTLYTEVPQALAVTHSSVLIAGATSFSVTANAGSLIALTVNGEIIGTADGTGSAVTITIPAQNPGTVVLVTVTKQNYYRYSSNVDVVATGVYADFTADDTDICTGSSVNFTDQSYGSITSWSWSFPGGSPSSYIGENPPSITYSNDGVYNVELTVSDGSDNDTETKTGYITVTDVVADFTGAPTTVIVGNTVTFTDNSDCNPTSWSWSFPNGTPNAASGIGPHTITYNTVGTYDVTLDVTNASGSDTETKSGYIDVINCNYCATSYSNTTDDYISNVSFGTINNPSSSTNYSDFTSISTNVTTGNAYSISANITVNGSWTQHCWAWIDWNRDCDFDDAGEAFDLGQTNGSAGTHNLSTNITVPSGASLGSTRMRVAELYSVDPTPCTNSQYGEAEDYTVVIQSNAAAPVANFIADNTSPGLGETISFTDNSTNTPTSWSWSFNPTTVTYVNSTSSTSQNPQVQFNSFGYYTVELTATNSSGNDTETKTDYINVSSYCGGAGNGTYLHISRVQLETIDNSSGQDSYYDYTYLSTDIALNQSYDITITNGDVYPDNDLMIWIDYNQDGDFSDSGEDIVCDIDNDGQGTFNFTVPGTALAGSTRMRIRTKYNGSDCGSPCGTTTYGEVEDYSVNITMPVPGFWVGTTSSDWDITSNWSDGNVPVLTTNVTIPSSPSGGNFPETNTGSGAECANLTIESGAHLFIPPTNTLTVSGSLTNNAGTAGFILKSNTNGTGSLIHNTASINATVERYLTDARWHFIGIPVSSSLVDVFHLPAGHSDIYLRTHNEHDNSWGAYIVPLGTPLALGRGYEAWVGDPNGFSQPETIEFFGNLNTGDFTTGLAGFYDLQYTNNRGLNLISNPYPSALQGNIDTWAKSKIANSIWTWSKDYGNYVFWGSGNDYGGGLFGTITGGVIPAMQGFFVEATGPNPNLTIPQTDRIHSGQAYYKESEIPANTLSLEVNANNYMDVVFVSFNDGATEDYDNYDVKKLFGLAEAPQLYSIILGRQLSINSLPVLSDYRTVQLGFECGLPGDYTINASGIESFNGSVSLYLEDTKEGVIQNLSSNPEYSFDYGLLDDLDRFVLHFGEPNGFADMGATVISIYANDGIVYILKPEGVVGNIVIYDMLGQEIISQKANSEGLIRIPVTNGTGYYVVTVQTDKNIAKQKVFIK